MNWFYVKKMALWGGVTKFNNYNALGVANVSILGVTGLINSCL